MSDSVQSLLGGSGSGSSGGHSVLTKMADAYSLQLPDGSTVYFPLKHYDKGDMIPFPSYDAAAQANSMSSSDAKRSAKDASGLVYGTTSGAPTGTTGGIARDILSGKADPEQYLRAASQGGTAQQAADQPSSLLNPSVSMADIPVADRYQFAPPNFQPQEPKRKKKRGGDQGTSLVMNP